MGTWYILFQPLFYFRSLLVAIENKKFSEIKTDRVTQSIIGANKECSYLGLQIKTDIASEHRSIADTKRKNTFHQNLYDFNPLRIEDKKEKEKIKFNPIFFEEVFSRPAGKKNESSSHIVKDEVDGEKIFEDMNEFDVHSESTEIEPNSVDRSMNRLNSTEQQRGDEEGINLVVLHHGFQGNNLDMLSLKHYFSLKYPKNYYHCAKANEENSEEDISLMGKKLALEIKEFIQVYVPGRKISKLSFVGHSMGGLIIRASLPHLKEYKDRMGCFMTVSTPHLGVNKGDSKLVEFGILFI